MEVRFPRALRRGDAVAVVSPASPIRDRQRAFLDAGMERLRRWGLRPRLMPNALERYRYLAGADEGRAADLRAAFADAELRAVFCARGGYGVTRILDALDPEALREDPKPIVGYSDITALQAWAWTTAKAVTVHGLNVVIPDSLAAGEELEELQRRLLFDADPPADLPMPTGDNPHVIRAGQAEGRLVGGNLSLVIALMGTPWEIDPTGAVLFLEDVHEEPYRIDRMLTQLRAAGTLRKCAAIVLGDFGVDEKEHEAEMTRTLRERLEDIGCPVARGFPFGHRPRAWSLPFGARARLDARDEDGTPVLTLLESAVK